MIRKKKQQRHMNLNTLQNKSNEHTLAEHRVRMRNRKFVIINLYIVCYASCKRLRKFN